MAHVLGMTPTKPTKKDKSILTQLFSVGVFPREFDLSIRSVYVINMSMRIFL
jgi:hypothetical protein